MRDVDMTVILCVDNPRENLICLSQELMLEKDRTIHFTFEDNALGGQTREGHGLPGIRRYVDHFELRRIVIWFLL